MSINTPSLSFLSSSLSPSLSHSLYHSLSPLTPTHTAAPALPQGKELNSSSTKRSAGLFSHLPSPDLGSIQVSDNDTEETKKETDKIPDLQISSASGRDSTGVKGYDIRIQVVAEGDDEEELNKDTNVVIRRDSGECTFT